MCRCYNLFLIFIYQMTYATKNNYKMLFDRQSLISNITVFLPFNYKFLKTVREERKLITCQYIFIYIYRPHLQNALDLGLHQTTDTCNMD